MAGRTRKPQVDEWEWLALIDADGPFLSRAALKSFFPSGLPKAHASVDDVNETFVDEFSRWSAMWTAESATYVKARDRWVEVVLRTLLDWSDELELAPAGFSANSPNGAVTIEPFAALAGEGETPAALVTLVDRIADLRAVGTDGWSASAIDRMSVLLRETGVPIGIVTDGRWWGLVSASKDVTTASGVWDALLWREERPSRDAFLALASFTSLAGGKAESRLPALFAESVASAEQITEALGDQVRRAVELVLQSMSDTHLRAVAQGEASPLPEDPRAVYEGAVTTLMRIVFILFAEERGLLPEHDLYRSAYAIAGLREQLQREATATSAEALDHSWEAWHRLLAASNAVYGGATFEDMRMPAYGGSLFDPERFPWLQATDAQGRLRVRLTDRAMLAVLRAVQTIEDGAMQLSFRDLDVEQIGYVYEGLLGYSAEYVTEVAVGLEGKPGFEPEIPLVELEQLALASESPKEFGEALVAHLKKTQEHARSRTAGQIAKAYGVVDLDAAADARTRLRHALLGDDGLAARLEPFHALIRDDLRGFPYVVPAGGLVMTESAQRANTGTHYTPRSLAEEVVLHALEPLVYSPGPLDVEDRTQWKLRASAEILDLKVADIAAGSGAFLVAAARYLADRVIEARDAEGVPISGEEPKRFAIREVVARCLYGADINGMAVEMCKLSLWLISMDPGKPFSFVDDRVFHGNSLLGVTTEAQLKALHIYPKSSMRRQLATIDVDRDLEGAARLRRELASGQVDDADRMRSSRAKRALLAQSRQVTAKLRDVADGIVAAGLREGGKPGRKLEESYENLAQALRDAYPSDGSDVDRGQLDAIVGSGLTPTVATGEARWKPLHWLLEVPDVIHDHGGFDAVIGNPPFFGGTKIGRFGGENYRNWLVNVVALGVQGSSDLVGYFLLRSAQLAHPQGILGLLATDSVSQGETRRVGLGSLIASGVEVFRSVRSRPWPAKSANIDYAAIWMTGRSVNPAVWRIADDRRVRRITELLEAPGAFQGMPMKLRNAVLTFEGCKPYGRGFVIPTEVAQDWIEEDAELSSVLFPYLSGDDVMGRADVSASRWIIDFNDMPLVDAARFGLAFAKVERDVKPERLLNARAARREQWWKFGERSAGMRDAISKLDEVLVLSRVSKTVIPVRVSARQVLSDRLTVFATDSYAQQAIYSSTIHWVWGVKYSTTRGAGVSYTPSVAIATFPAPPESDELEAAGRAMERARSRALRAHDVGITGLYNMVNDPNETRTEIEAVRESHRRVDIAVLQAYGWSEVADIRFGHFEFRGLVRYGIDPRTRDVVLDRLLEENHRRAAVEAQSAPTKSKRGKSFEESKKPEGAMF